MKIRKITFTKPGKVALEQADLNENIKDKKELIVKNQYSLISPGTELACLSGLEGWFPLPNTPGYISVGSVLDKGDAVEGVEIGDTVLTYGPHKDIFKIDTTDRFGGFYMKVPKNVNPELVPFTRMASIAITSLRQSDIQLGDFVLVSGSGLVGNLTAQMAQLQGARVIAIDVNEKRIEMAKKCGIENTINSSSPDYKDDILEITKEKKVSTFIDATGISKVINDNIELVANYGEVILLGSPRVKYETNVTDIFNHEHLRGVKIKGALEWLFPTQPDEFVKHSLVRNSEIILDLIGKDKLKVKPLFTHKLKPEEAEKAYNGLKNYPDEFVGVIFDWNN